MRFPARFKSAVESPDADRSQLAPARARRRVVASSCAVVGCLLLLTACGTAAASGARGAAGHTPAALPSDLYPGYPMVGVSSPSVGPSSAGATARVFVHVTIYPADNARPAYYTLRCAPAGGTVPDPAAACARLLADPGLLEPATTGRVMMCPMILVGGARAVVYGTYLGRQVNETIYDGGCDVPRWAELTQIFG